jgi:catalase
VETGADFAKLQAAIGGSAPGTPSPTPIEQFLGSHPAALRFVMAPKPPVKSFGTQNFFMLNAFKFIAPDGKETFVRYRVIPDDGVQTLEQSEAEAKGPNYLFEELKEMVKNRPIGFKLLVQIAEDGDTTDNITVEWPDERKLVELGSLKIESVLEDSLSQQKHDIFDPIPRVDGIEPSTDPILEFRAGLYLISGRERRGA